MDRISLLFFLIKGWLGVKGVRLWVLVMCMPTQSSMLSLVLFLISILLQVYIFHTFKFYSRYLIVMNVTNIPELCLILRLALIGTLLLNPSSLVYCLYSSMTRLTTLPIEVKHGVAYLELGRLCEAEIVNTVVGTEIKSWIQESESQFEQLSSYQPQTDVKVLLDTGSSQFWLADSACSGCGRTKSLCPHLSAPEKKITYMKGFIEGADSYINLCNNRIKFTCVKSAVSIGQISGEGILGLKQGTVGLNMLFNIVKKRSTQYSEQQVDHAITSSKQQQRVRNGQRMLIERNEIGFSFGKFTSHLSLSNSRIVTDTKQLPEQVYDFQIKSDKNWSFEVQSLSLFDSTITIGPSPTAENKQQPSMVGYVDTGSSKIVLTGTICASIIKQMKQELDIECRYEEDKGIDCNRIIKGLNLEIKLAQIRNNTNMVLRIENSKIIDKNTNQLQILCQSSSKNNNTIILGHPFLQSLPIVFTIDNIKHQSTQRTVQTSYKIRVLQNTGAANVEYETSVYRFLMILYTVAVAVLSWAAVVALNFIRRKRSTQIII